MKLDTDVINFNLKLLRVFALHDSLTAFLGVLAIVYFLPYIGIAILLFPIAEFVFFFFTTKPVPNHLGSKIRNSFPYSGTYLLRNCGKRPSQVISLPFARMICLSDNDLKHACTHSGVPEEQDRARCIVAHELGHLDQYDRIIFRWLQISFVALIISAALGFLILLIAPLFINAKWSLQMFYYLAIFAVISLFLFSSISRVVQRREYIADMSGCLITGHSYLEFLSAEARLEKRLASSNQPHKKWNAFTHPSFAHRKNAILQVLPAAMAQSRLIAFQWGTILILAYILLIPNFGSQQTLAAISFILLATWPFAAICSLSQNSNLARMLLREYALGFLCVIAATGFVYWYGNLIGFYIQSPNNTVADGVLFLLLCFIGLGLVYVLSLTYFSIKNKRQNSSFKLPLSYFLRGHLDFWKGVFFITLLNILFFTIGRFASSWFPQVYPEYMPLIAAEFIAYAATFGIFGKLGLIRLLNEKELRQHWGSWRNAAFFVVGFIFVFYMSAHFVNGLRFPISNPALAAKLYESNVLLFLWTIVLVTFGDFIAWFILCVIAREKS